MASLETLIENIRLVQDLSKKTGKSLDEIASFFEFIKEYTTPDRSDDAVRNAALEELSKIYGANPDGNFDARELATKVGLKPTRSDFGYVRRAINKLRLEYHPTQVAPAE